ncbi:MAG: Ig-like domain-containing protein, partial [Rhodoferax sp.]|uniref:Ig-like domain-containing protein n=1 Tax=Rhodoferax sp. TaxID=50421 RepID=UPI0027367648
MLRNRAFFRPRSSALALEPRVMFDAAGAMAASDHMLNADLDVSQGDGTTPDNAPALRASEADTPAAPAPDTLLIIDARVSNYQGLLTDLPGTVQVRVIQVGESGLNAITAALQGSSGLRSIQIISHGSSGNVTLGSDALNSATLSSHSAQVQAWGSHLSADADILLFGCDVAAGPGGSTLLTQLATLTGADIAASTDATGATVLGGNWVLESATGAIESRIAINDATIAGFDGLLFAPIPASITPVDGNSTDTGQVTVQEAGLVSTGDTSETNTGSVTLVASQMFTPASISLIFVQGTSDRTVTISELNDLINNPITIPTSKGALTLTSYTSTSLYNGVSNAGTLAYSYTLTQVQTTLNATESTETIALGIQDDHGFTGTDTLTVRIVDDVPTANADTNSVTEDGIATVTGNIFGSSGASSDDVSDRIGADATATPVTAVLFNSNSKVLGTAFATTYGTLMVNAGGSYSYTLNNANPTVNALNSGDILTEQASYTITDTDGDTSTATLTITIHGTNDAPTAVADVGAVNAYATLATTVSTGVVQLAPGTDTDVDNTTASLMVSGGVVGNGAVTQSAGVATSLAGTYGHLTLAADGHYSYIADNASGLAVGATADDVFTYTVKDPSGLVSNATTLTITVTGVSTPTQPVYNWAPGGGGVTFFENAINVTGEVINAVATLTDADNSSNYADGFIHITGLKLGQDVVSLPVGAPAVDGNVQLTGNNVEYRSGGAWIIIGTTSGVVGTNFDIDLNANATTPIVQQVIRNFTFANTSDHPIAIRPLWLIVDDGDGGTLPVNGAGVDVTIIRDNDAPVMSASTLGGTYTENNVTPLQFVAGTISVSDPDAPANFFSGGAGSLTVALDSYAVADDTLSILHQGTGAGQIGFAGGTVTYSGVAFATIDTTFDGIGKDLVINFSSTAATPAAVQALLGRLTYSNLFNQDPTVDHTDPSRAFTVTLNDGANTKDGGSLTTALTAQIAGTITVTAVNDTPEIHTNFPFHSVTWIENTAAAIIDNSFTVNDKDDTHLVGGTIRFTPSSGNFLTGDVLAVTDVGSIVSSYDPGTGILTLSGTDTLANYQTVVRSLTYLNSTDDPTSNLSKQTRKVDYSLTDANSDLVGAATGVSQFTGQVIINITATTDKPVMSAGGSLSYTVNQAAQTIDTSVAVVSDADDTQMASATVQITTGLATGDVLAVAGTAIGNQIAGTSITVTSYNSGTGLLTLTGPDTLANFTTVLKTVAFSGTSSGNRTVTWQTTDANSDNTGAGQSLAVTSSITVAAASTITPIDGNGAATGEFTVQEAGLTSVGDTSETATGSITLAAANGIANITVGGTTVSLAALNALGTTPISINTAQGAITLTGYVGNATNGTLAYSYTLGQQQTTLNATESSEPVALSILDSGGGIGSGTLTVHIVDDVPTANADTNSVTENGTATVTGNVFATGSANDMADRLGADSTATPVSAISIGGNAKIVGTAFATAYGNLTLNGNGSYSYTLDNNNASVNALHTGQSLSELVTYTLTDSDGDSSSSTLTLTINGHNDGTPSIGGGAALANITVWEAGLTSVDDTSEVNTGTMDPRAPDGMVSITVGSTVVTLAQLNDLTANPVSITTTEGIIKLTNYTSISSVGGVSTEGTLAYQYTLTQTQNTPNATEKTVVLPLSILDAGGTTSSGYTLTVHIIDDVPTANADANSVTEDGTATVSGNVLGAFTQSAGDVIDRVGADASGMSSPMTSINFNNSAKTLGTAFNTSYGSLTINQNGTYSYTLNNSNATVNALNSGQSLTETANYTITDTDGDTSSTTLTLTINGSNDAPVATADSGAVNAGATLTRTNLSGVIQGLGTDTDVDNTTASLIVSGAVAGAGAVTQNTGVGTSLVGVLGHLTLATDGSYSYLADNANSLAPGASANDVFTYTVKDPGGLVSNTTTLTITVSGPQVVNDLAATTEDNAVTTNVLSNDSLSGTTVISAVTQGAHGTVVVNLDKTITYTPVADFNGADSYTYTATNGSVTESATVSVTVSAVADITNDALTTPEDLAITSNVITGSNGATADNFEGTPVLSSVTQGSNGTVTFTGAGAVTYTPNPNYNGSDSFDYTVTSPTGVTEIATVNVTITSVNDLPVAVTDSFIVQQHIVLNGTLASNDTPSGDGGNVWAIGLTQPTLGTVVINTNGSFTYTQSPFNNYSYYNHDSFTYKITDANNDSSTATVNITFNDAPAAANFTYFSTSEDTPIPYTILYNFNIIHQSLDSPNVWTLDNSITAAHGTVLFYTIGAFSYTPNANYAGSDVFAYRITDANGDYSIGTVTIPIAVVNDAPVAVADIGSVNKDATLTVSAASGVIQGLGTDTDVDNTTVSLVVSGAKVGTGSVTQNVGVATSLAGSFGHLTLDPTGSYSYVADSAGGLAPGSSSNDVFSYTVKDPGGLVSNATTLTITVSRSNAAPVNTVPVGQTMNEDTALAFTGPSTISVNDVDGNLATTQLTVLSGNLTVDLTGTGATINAGANASATFTLAGTQTQINAALASLIYQGQANFFGTDILTVLSTDSAGTPLSDTDPVSIRVFAVNDAPVANSDTASVSEGLSTSSVSQVTGNVVTAGSGIDTDADG